MRTARLPGPVVQAIDEAERAATAALEGVVRCLRDAGVEIPADYQPQVVRNARGVAVALALPDPAEEPEETPDGTQDPSPDDPGDDGARAPDPPGDATD